LTLLIIFASGTVEAKERIRFDCELYKMDPKNSGEKPEKKPMKDFVLRINESTQQFVTPERKFFIDLKASQIKTYENSIEKTVEAMKLILWVYDDFTAHYESQEHLMAKASQDFVEDTRFMKVEAVHQLGQKVESYRVECTRLEKINIPKHLTPRKKKKSPSRA